jgi:conjugal transfer pilus assembly protein TraF
MKIFHSIITMACLSIVSHALPLDDHGIKGWLWYKHSIKKNHLPKEFDKDNTLNSNPQKPQLLTYRDRLKKEQEMFEEIQARAVVEPTLFNVQAFQKAQNLLLTQSVDFGKLWMVASLLDSKNYKTSDPSYPLHRKIYNAQEEKKLDSQIRTFAKTFGLFFVFKENCSYCHGFAPIVKEFIDTYGFDYKAISPDGQNLPDFPKAIADNGMIKRINPDGIYPSLYLVNPHTREVIPLSRGLVNLTELRTNMKLIINNFKRIKNHA